jgi:DegV family protein with EDD domain
MQAQSLIQEVLMLAILTDSTCDIPEEMIDQYGILVVPQMIIWGDEQFRDRVDLQPLDFYQRLQVDSQRPTTSQASVSDFLLAIDESIANGATEAVILTVSSAMSGTYQVAKTAGEQAEIPVLVIDSKGPSMSLGWQVLATARARDEGATMAEISERVAVVRDKLGQIVALQTLEYLKTGGRIGDAAKWVGTMLKVKPVVAIDHQKGVVAPVGLARTHKSATNLLYKKFFEGANRGDRLRIAVLHGNVLQDAQKLADRIREDFDPVELIINITGPVLGINTGPGALALCGYFESQ